MHDWGLWRIISKNNQQNVVDFKLQLILSRYANERNDHQLREEMYDLFFVQIFAYLPENHRLS